MLQNELNGNAVRFTTHNQTCLATNQAIAGCKKVLQEVDLLFATKSVHFTSLPAQGKLVLEQVT